MVKKIKHETSVCQSSEAFTSNKTRLLSGTEVIKAITRDLIPGGARDDYKVSIKRESESSGNNFSTAFMKKCTLNQFNFLINDKCLHRLPCIRLAIVAPLKSIV